MFQVKSAISVAGGPMAPLGGSLQSYGKARAARWPLEESSPRFCRTRRWSCSLTPLRTSDSTVLTGERTEGRTPSNGEMQDTTRSPASKRAAVPEGDRASKSPSTLFSPRPLRLPAVASLLGQAPRHLPCFLPCAFGHFTSRFFIYVFAFCSQECVRPVRLEQPLAESSSPRCLLKRQEGCALGERLPPCSPPCAAQASSTRV